MSEEGMRQTAQRAESAEQGIRSASAWIDESVRKFETLVADGYGNNVTRLIELLENDNRYELARAQLEVESLTRSLVAREALLASISVQARDALKSFSSNYSETTLKSIATVASTYIDKTRGVCEECKNHSKSDCNDLGCHPFKHQ